MINNDRILANAADAAMLVEVPVGVPDTWLEFALSPLAFTADTT